VSGVNIIRYVRKKFTTEVHGINTENKKTNSGSGCNPELKRVGSIFKIEPTKIIVNILYIRLILSKIEKQ